MTAPGAPAGWTVPDGYEADNVATCRGCEAEILWAYTPRRARMPLDRDGRSHFATCPNAKRFRRSAR